MSTRHCHIFRSESWSSPQNLLSSVHPQHTWLQFHIDTNTFGQLLRLKGLTSSVTPPNTLTKRLALPSIFIYHFSTSPRLTSWANVPLSNMLFVDMAFQQVIQILSLLLSLFRALNSAAKVILLKCKLYRVNFLAKTSNGLPTHSEWKSNP